MTDEIIYHRRLKTVHLRSVDEEWRILAEQENPTVEIMHCLTLCQVHF
jgi:hypothetical protein